MNIVPCNIPPVSRCGNRNNNSDVPTAIRTVLTNNIGKTCTIYTAGSDNNGFTGLLSSMGGGCINLVTPAPGVTSLPVNGGGNCRCRGNGGNNLGALSVAASTISLVIPLNQITAVALPNI